jgi:hypothetical protein
LGRLWCRSTGCRTVLNDAGLLAGASDLQAETGDNARRANKLAGVLFSVKAITQENIASGKIMRADLAYGFNRLKHRHVRRVRADRADRNVIGAVPHQRNQRARKPAPSIHPRRRLKPSLRRAPTSLFSLVERERMGNTTVEITGGVATTVSPAPLPGVPLPVVTSPAPVVS